MQQMESVSSDGNLETHRLPGPDVITMVVKPVEVHSGPGFPSRYRVEYKRPPTSMPPPTPKVVVSPSYNTGVVFNSHYDNHLGGTMGSSRNGNTHGYKMKNEKKTSRVGTAGDVGNVDDVDSDEGI